MSIRPFRKNPIAVSFTGWKRYRECAQQHYLVMTGQRPKFRDERNFFRGIVLHQVMEDWFKNDEPPAWLATAVQPTWERLAGKHTVLWKHATDEQTMLGTALEWGEALTKIFTDELPIRKDLCRAEMEVERTFEVDGFLVCLRGKIDVLATAEEGAPIVLDLKGSASKSTMDPWQIVFYSLMLDDKLPEGQHVSHGGFIMPAFGRIFPYEVTQEHRDWLMESITQMARDIMDDKFDPDPSDSKCFMCDVKHACPVRGGMMPQGTGRQLI